MRRTLIYEGTESAMGIGGRRGLGWLLGSTMLAAAPGPALAVDEPVVQLAQAADEVHQFSVPAKPLGQAITDVGAVGGWRIVFAYERPYDITTAPLSGRFTTEQALRRLLSGTGFALRVTGDRSATIVPLPPAGQSSDGSLALDPIIVQGAGGSPWGPVHGYVAEDSASGSKTDTPLIETPQSISVITRDQMTAQGVESLAQALRYTPGVAGELYGTDVRSFGLQMRGFTVGNDAFYLNGLRMRGSGYGLFNALDPYGAERIEVLRGPTSVLYGQNSPGGLINYVSKRPAEDPFREIEFGAGSFGRYQGQFDLNGALTEDGTWTGRVTGLMREGDTQTDFVDDDRIFIAPALTFRPDDDTSLTLLGHYQRDRTGWGMQYLPAAGTVFRSPFGRVPASRFIGEPSFDEYNTTTASAGWLFEHRFDDTWTVLQNARYSYLQHDEKGVFGGGLQEDGRTYDRYADAGGARFDGFAVDNQVQAKFDTGAVGHTVLAGLDYQSASYNDYAASGEVDPIDIFDPKYGATIGPLTPYTDKDVSVGQTGIYLQDQIAWQNWRLILGGRHDWAYTDSVERLTGERNHQEDSAFTWRAGLVYLSDIGLAPYFSYSESFQPSIGIGSDGQVFKPETGRQYEIGVKYQPPGANAFVTVSAYDLTKQNLVRYVGLDTIQTGEVRVRGVELEAVASFEFGLDVTAAYTYTDAEITDDAEGNKGNSPFGVPKHRASLWADYTIHGGDWDGIGFGGGVRYIGDSEGDDANTFDVPDATLFDAAIHYDWRDLRFQINASNLFDRTYVASCYDAGFGCFYGEGRKVVGTVRYRW
ncbi:TonB-dependent siderophore receptor [Inquilinus sp. OTU3971]|uniref:TonB-dependent siderophore receptor n=1 Tax=Inquilinus sp. OTU3971 TaxID=3043855 RepID=UPI00313E60B4